MLLRRHSADRRTDSEPIDSWHIHIEQNRVWVGLAKETAQNGVLVNCITPAVIEIDLLKQVSKTHIDYMLSKIPMGRFGMKEEAAALVAWLCSKDCSFSTGAVFDLSGGRATY